MQCVLFTVYTHSFNFSRSCLSLLSTAMIYDLYCMSNNIVSDFTFSMKAIHSSRRALTLTNLIELHQKLSNWRLQQRWWQIGQRGNLLIHDDVIKWKNFARYWPFVRGIPVTGEIPTQRPVTRSFDVFFDLCLNKRLSKQSCGLWFETPSRQWWRHCNGSVWLCHAYLSWLTFSTKLYP